MKKYDSREQTQSEWMGEAIKAKLTFAETKTAGFDWSGYYPITHITSEDAEIIGYQDGYEPIGEDYALVDDTYIVSIDDIREWGDDQAQHNFIHEFDDEFSGTVEPRECSLSELLNP